MQQRKRAKAIGYDVFPAARFRGRRRSFFVVCDNIRSLENVGSIFRTADAFAVDKIFLCGISGKPPSHKISKTALGAEYVVPWEYHKQTWRLLDQLKAKGVCIAALEQSSESIPLSKFVPKFPMALVLGHEVKGVSVSALARTDAIIEIPMHGKKESLNVAVAFGIAGYEIQRKRASFCIEKFPRVLRERRA